MAGAARRGTVALTRRELRRARRRRALRLLATGLVVGVLVVLAIGAAERIRREAPAAQTVVVVPEPASVPTTQPAPTPAPTVTPPPPGPAQTSAPRPAPSAADCYAVRDAGGGPIRRGDYGYAAHLDSDGDGVACEYLPRR